MSGTAERAERDQPLAGIDDRRSSYPDPQLSRDEDARIAHRLQELAPETSFEKLLDEHWRMGGKQSALAARFTAHELKAEAKSAPIVAAIDRARGTNTHPGERVLEVGCGTAALAAAFATRGADVAATDVSLRWLALAQKRLGGLAAGTVELVACAAEALPFPDGSFDVVAASDVIEHVEDPRRFVAEAARVLRPGGMLFLATPNRYSLALEPHVRLWGVGYLPRSLAETYVRALRKTSYSHVRLLSAAALSSLLRDHRFDAEIVTPPVPDEGLYAGVELALVRAYNRVRRNPVARPVLRAVGPFFHVFARKRLPEPR